MNNGCWQSFWWRSNNGSITKQTPRPYLWCEVIRLLDVSPRFRAAANSHHPNEFVDIVRGVPWWQEVGLSYASLKTGRRLKVCISDQLNIQSSRKYSASWQVFDFFFPRPLHRGSLWPLTQALMPICQPLNPLNRLPHPAFDFLPYFTNYTRHQNKNSNRIHNHNHFYHSIMNIKTNLESIGVHDRIPYC